MSGRTRRAWRWLNTTTYLHVGCDHAGLHQRVHDLEAHIERLHRQNPFTDRASLLGEVRKSKHREQLAVATTTATQRRLAESLAVVNRVKAERDELRDERDAARMELLKHGLSVPAPRTKEETTA